MDFQESQISHIIDICMKYLSNWKFCLCRCMGSDDGWPSCLHESSRQDFLSEAHDLVLSSEIVLARYSGLSTQISFFDISWELSFVFGGGLCVLWTKLPIDVWQFLVHFSSNNIFSSLQKEFQSLMEETWLEVENDILCVEMKTKKKDFGLNFF